MGGFSRTGFGRSAFGRGSATTVAAPVLELGTGISRSFTRSPFTHRQQFVGSRSAGAVELVIASTVAIGTTSAASCEVETVDLTDAAEFATTSGASVADTAFEWTVLLLTSTGGSLAEDAFSTYQAFDIDTSTGAYMSTPEYSDVLDLNLLKLKEITIRRSASDKMWGFSTQVSGATDPDIDLYPMVIISALDHEGVQRVLFSGLTPDIKRTYAAVRSGTGIGGYDYAWYLSHQYVPQAYLVTPSTALPHETIESLIEGSSLQPYRLSPVTGWGTSVEASAFSVESKTTKQTLIDAICDATNSVFYTKPTATGSFPPSAYFVREDLIDDPDSGLDLPDLVTVTNPDPYLLSPVSHESSGSESYNRVIVRGTSQVGRPLEAIVETDGVSDGDDMAIEYLEDDAKYDTQIKCQDRAIALFNYFASKPVVYSAKFTERVDLQLYQRMRFVGYTEIPDDVLRIIEIEYRLEPPNKRTVSVLLAKVAAMKTYAKLLKEIKPNATTVIETITRAVVEQTPSFKLGTVRSVSGNYATVDLDMGGTIVARIP